ncbi:L,D-transpeptidase [Brucella cytisi]|uniref:L,D-transpeptidase n=1 Tax=Brucella cytisi TaxID=407152 RepID=UPI0035DCE809
MRNKLLSVVLVIILGEVITGCSTVGETQVYTASYTAVNDTPYTVPAVPTDKIPVQYRRQIVPFQTTEIPGTIIVDTKSRFLYLVLQDGKAMRYGIGVGREGFSWSGTARVAMKRPWPVWTPPAEMIRRQPKLAKYEKGMEPGLDNPLGARALYLFDDQGDTGYRLHGTPEWWSIGKAMSSGCIRLVNQDIIDLYDRVDKGAKVVVL